MAKKRLNLRSTMTKNQDTELPKKIELKRSTKNIDEVKEKVEAIHVEEQVVPKATPLPTKNRARKSKKVLTTDKDEIVRITIDLPKDLHKKLKIHAVMNEVTIRNYVVGLLQKSLN
ncbi:MAG: hypothetical protein ACI94Y_001934 [Maribacter sp.]|jgi:hypothetical protein